MGRLTVSVHLDQHDTEMVKYERYKIGIEGSVGLYFHLNCKAAHSLLITTTSSRKRTSHSFSPSS